MRKEDVKADFRPVKRTSQIVYGERQHLVTVLESITQFQDIELDAQHPLLSALIDARTEELNNINPDWEAKIEKARDPRTSPEELTELAMHAPLDDWLLLRTVAEHPNTTVPVLSYLSRHPYTCIGEIIARHPNADGETLERLAADEERPLWVLVAANGAAPEPLRQKLLKRLHEAAEPEVGKATAI